MYIVIAISYIIKNGGYTMTASLALEGVYGRLARLGLPIPIVVRASNVHDEV